MTETYLDLTELVSSRICHDLISPLGAIGNGLELLSLTRGETGAEYDLISESLENAKARLRFYRLAFGAAPDGSEVDGAEILALLAPGADGRRISLTWSPAHGPLPRTEVKLAFLLILCLETACPWGAVVEVTRQRGRWQLMARAEKLQVDQALWEALTLQKELDSVPPAQVHFPLAANFGRAIGREVSVVVSEHEIILAF